MARWIRTDGKDLEVKPKDGKHFSLEELQAYIAGPDERRYGDRIGGTVEFIYPEGKILAVNENGWLIPLEHNERASLLWRELFPIEKYGGNNRAYLTGVVGNVLLMDPSEVE